MGAESQSFLLCIDCSQDFVVLGVRGLQDVGCNMRALMVTYIIADITPRVPHSNYFIKEPKTLF